MSVAALALATATLTACTSYESAYEKSVYDFEPIYCYQTLGTVDCHRRPFHRDADRLVNFYGPAPSKYAPPPSPRLKPLQPPPDRPVYHRDPEPAPEDLEDSVDVGEDAEGDHQEATPDSEVDVPEELDPADDIPQDTDLEEQVET